MGIFIQERGYEFRVMIEDVGRLIKQQQRTPKLHPDHALNYYRTLKEVRFC